jgi:hypothetical protein
MGKAKFMSRNYDGFTKDNKNYYATHFIDNKMPALPSGIYRTDFDPATKRVYLYETSLESDEIIDLPSAEYQEMIALMDLFLRSSTRQKYENLGFLYKRNILFHGVPGTGKTVLVNRITRSAVENQKAIVLFVENGTPNGANGVQLLEHVVSFIADTNKNSLLVIIFEEVDELIRRNERMLLTFLDGQMQRPNTICLGTTNYIGRIPARFLRPGRFSQTVEVGNPSFEARRFYLAYKLGEEFEHLNDWAKRTEGLSIDEMKEVIQACYILQQPFERVVNRLRVLKGMPGLHEEEGDTPINQAKQALFDLQIAFDGNPEIQAKLNEVNQVFVGIDAQVSQDESAEEDYEDDN